MLLSGAAYLAKAKPIGARSEASAASTTGADAENTAVPPPSTPTRQATVSEQLYYRGPRSGKIMPITPEAQRFMRRARVKRFSADQGDFA